MLRSVDTRDLGYLISPKGAVYELTTFKENANGVVESIPGAIYVDDEGEFLASEDV